MEILKLIPKDEIISFEGTIPILASAVPTISIEEANESSLLFLYEKAMGKTTEEELSFIEKISPLAIVCETNYCIKNKNIPVIRVKNARKAMSYAFSNYYSIDYSTLKFIGVTGTNGKSSTSYMLYRILSDCGIKCGYIGTGRIEICNKQITDEFYSMTTPDPPMLYKSIKKMQCAGCTNIIMEVSSHSIYLSKISPINFEVGIFTNLSEEHLDFHKNMWEYYQVKSSFILNCKKAIVNTDDTYGCELYDEIKGEKYSVGVVYPSDARAVDIAEKGHTGLSYFYKEKDIIFKVNLHLFGLYNVYNSLLALKAAIVLGIKPYLAKKAISDILEIEGRLSIIKDSMLVAIDYAHTPFAMQNVLKTLLSIKNSGQKLIVIFGCGGERDKYKRKKMGEAAFEYADEIYITEDNSRNEPFENILADILSGISLSENLKVIKDRKKAIRTAILSAHTGDIVAIIGKGNERYIIDKNGRRPFSEKEIVRAALEERKKKYENTPSFSS